MAQLVEPAPKLSIYIHSTPARQAQAIADTGASCSIFPYKMVRGVIPINNEEKIVLTTANGQIMACEGMITVPISIANKNDQIIPISALVSSELHENVLLGWQDCRTLGVIPASFPQPISPPEGMKIHEPIRVAHLMATNKRIEALMDQYKDTVFNEDSLPPMHGQPMRISVNKNHPDYKPMRCLTARRYPAHMEQDAEA